MYNTAVAAEPIYFPNEVLFHELGEFLNTEGGTGEGIVLSNLI
jgi:hypothetical protein